MYIEFAIIYDRLMRFDYQSFILILEKLWKDISPKTILDMGCGTGNMAFYLENKYFVQAFDLSENMLLEAKKKLKRTVLFHASFLNFQVREPVDVALCMFNGFNYLSSLDEFNQAVFRVAENLKEEGYFIFDINTYYALKYRYGNDILSEDIGGIHCIWKNRFFENERKLFSQLNIYFSEKNQNRHICEKQVQTLFYVSEIFRLLEQNHLRVLGLMDLETGKKPKKNCSRLMFICQKIRNRAES